MVFYDSGDTYVPEYREWYLKMRMCLREKLPFILKETGVFEKKGIDPARYRITFRHITNLPKQGVCLVIAASLYAFFYTGLHIFFTMYCIFNYSLYLMANI